MHPSFPRALCALLSVMCLFSVACSDDTSTNPDPSTGGTTTSSSSTTPTTSEPDAGDTSGDVGTDTEDDVQGDVVEDDVVSCEPNTILGCVVENTQGVFRCNARGDEIFQSSCGNREVCREGACVEVECIPGTRVCQDEQTPLLCNEDGSALEPQNICTDGAKCSDGACLDPCELAEQDRSYVGCEYWPVELGNYLLYDEDETSTPEAPFAVVLSNPNNENANITVYTPEGDVLTSVSEVFIPKGLVDPRFTSTTVYTEILDAQGNRIGAPIEGPLSNVPLPPGAQLQVLLPRRATTPFVSNIERLAWHVVSDRPVTAYQFNPICCNYSFTNDASILLPKGTLTENYVAMSYPTWTPRSDISYPSTLTIVATEDDTEVTVTMRDPIIRPGNIPALDENGSVTVTMQAQEVLNIEAGQNAPLPSGEAWPTTDITGSVVAASKPVAVFGSHTCTDVPTTLAACDHVEQQMFPSETWGRNYIAAPLKIRTEQEFSREATYWKFLAQKDETLIAFDRPFLDIHHFSNPNQPFRSSSSTPSCHDKLRTSDAFETTIVLQKGESCEFGSRVGFSVSANEPILLGAFMSGQESAGFDGTFGNLAGDPAFFLAPPQEQYRDNYAFLTPATYALDFATIIAPVGASLVLDGTTIDPTAFDHDFIRSQNVVYAHIPLSDGPHTLTSSQPFGLVVYAYDDYVSYAFTGGLNLTKIND